MTLGTLNLRSQKQTCGDRGCRHCLVIQMCQEKISSAIGIGVTFCGDQIKHDIVPGAIISKTLNQKILQGTPIDITRCRTTD